MSEHDDPELEQLLRRALHDHAAQIMPRGDGLQRIQERVGRRRHLHWLRPAMATLAAAVAAVAIIAVPSMFNDSKGGNDHSTAAGPHKFSVRSAPRTTPTPTQAPLQAPVAVAWPYGTMAQAKAKARTRAVAARLSNPAAVATDMVRAFAGSGAKFELGLSTKVSTFDGQARVAVNRTDTDRPVCVVELTQVTGSKAYVVTAATSTGVRIYAAPDLRNVKAPTKLSGTASPGKNTGGTVLLNIRAPGQRFATAIGDGFINAKGVPNQAWDATLNPSPIWPAHAVVAAWTQDGNGLVDSFAALPAQSGTVSAMPTR